MTTARLPGTRRPDRGGGQPGPASALTTLLATPLLLCACGGGGAGLGQPSEDSTLYASTGTAARLQAQIDLGRELFFEERLSRPTGIACGTCHDPFLGWSDARPQGKGIQDHTLSGDTDGDGIDDHDTHLAVAGNYFKTILTGRNTPTVYNAHLFSNLFWDGRAGDLKHQTLFPFEGFNEMNSSWQDHIIPFLVDQPHYVEMFDAAYGSPRVTQQRAADAIGAYEETISVFDTPYDKFLAGDLTAMTAQEQAGMEVFFNVANCASCHPAPLLTDMQFHNLGVPTAGTFALTGGIDLGAGLTTDLTQTPPVAIDNPADYAKFKTPQLRMVSVTGPYFHNGWAASLEDLVEFFDQGGGPDLSGNGTKDPLIVPLGLTSQQKSDLVAFLRTGLAGAEIK